MCRTVTLIREFKLLNRTEKILCFHWFITATSADFESINFRYIDPSLVLAPCQPTLRIVWYRLKAAAEPWNVYLTDVNNRPTDVATWAWLNQCAWLLARLRVWLVSFAPYNGITKLDCGSISGVACISSSTSVNWEAPVLIHIGVSHIKQQSPLTSDSWLQKLLYAKPNSCCIHWW